MLPVAAPPGAAGAGAGDAAGGQPDALCARQYARRGENGFYPYRPCQGDFAGAHGDLKHALRNALLPIITLLGFELPGLFSGGDHYRKGIQLAGQAIHIDSLAARDYPVLMGFLFLAVLTIVRNLLADVLYAWADPRIRVRS
ncbi:ABC transporter permease subunit [Klebsiella pneumoniae]|uniref:ABC transporter permease subunit n=1 Tax=Klebsiella pneumoniae TaxID=573 RepID=UPI002B489CF7|nr:ABC transporter permease subunit [Klebsiella pneumoniae]